MEKSFNNFCFFRLIHAFAAPPPPPHTMENVQPMHMSVHIAYYVGTYCIIICTLFSRCKIVCK